MDYVDWMALEFVIELSNEAMRNIQILIRNILICEKCVWPHKKIWQNIGVYWVWRSWDGNIFTTVQIQSSDLPSWVGTLSK